MTTASQNLRLMKFVTVFECGGTERQFLNLGLALEGRGFDLRFGCLRKSGRLLEELIARNIPVDEYPLRSLYSARCLQKQVELARDLVRQRTEIVHAYNLYGNVFAVPAARMAGVPLVIAGIRDQGVYLTPWKRRVQRMACRMADLVVVNAQAIKDWLVSDGYAPEKIVVIRNGIDLAKMNGELVPGGAALRREFGIPPTAPLISTIARLCPSKGFDVALEALPHIHARYPDARLLIVGEGLRSVNGSLVPDHTYRRELEFKAQSLGVADRVVFAGYRQDVPSILRQVDLSVQPSHTEGLSNSVLEAMAAGAAVVATPVGGTPEVMTHGETGWLTPPGNAKALADGVCLLLDDPARRRRLGDAAAQHIRDRYSVAHMVDATARLYRDMLARKRARLCA